MRKLFLGLCLLGLFSPAFAQQINITPKPVSVKTGNGSFTISKKTVIAARDEEDRKAANFLNDYLQQYYGFKLDVDRQEGDNYIRLTTRKFIKAPEADAYTMNVLKEGVTIEGDTYAGTFYGIQTLIQLLPVPVNKTGVTKSEQLSIPFMSVQDQPRFTYRGMHLDVGRHLFPLDFIKKYIDYIALHKMNYFHWHLTEDQGWRIEIKKYPKLQEVAAYRNGTLIGRYPGTGNDNLRYGGYYTQDEVKQIVQYAADRHITVVPEIELPGHSSAAIAAYPWLSCFPQKPTFIPTAKSEKSKQDSTSKLVQETWGVFDDVYCAGKDSTFTFLQDVMDEVLALFPSNYIHVGGDESPKAHWKICPNCQKRIKEEGLKDEHELQSYFIQRMEKYLNAKGRTIIGWDEILEGGLAPNAVVMSWRGEAGGIEAAKQKHKVIMTPGSHVYFDHTQSSTEDSVTFGGFTPLEKVYAYEPVPAVLTAEQGKYILGAQANLWTEYIKNTRKVEYQLFPRLAALSEVLWSPKDQRNWANFEKRLPGIYDRYDLWGANYSLAYYDIKATVQPTPGNKGVAIKMETGDKTGKLTYGVGGKHFQKNYTAPVVVTKSGNVTAVYAKNNNILDSLSIDLNFNKATGKKVTLKEQPSQSYPGDGAFTLVNGIQNTKGFERSREFVGFNTGGMEATIDLGATQKIAKVVVHAFEQDTRRIYRPSSVQVLGSADGKSFKPLGTTQEYTRTQSTQGFNITMTATFNPATARYVKVVVTSLAAIPEGRSGAGGKPWLFVDEIEVL